MPSVIEHYDMDDESYQRIRIRGCLWPSDAWVKVQRASMRAVKLLDEAELVGIGVVHPPEITSVTFLTANKARGRQSDWEIVFEAPGGRRGRISDAISIVRGRVVGEFIEAREDEWALRRANVIKQILTTTGHGPRRLRGARRDEMSSELYPTFRLKNGLYDVVFST